MEFEEFKNVFHEKSKLISVFLDDEQVEQFYKYMCLLLEWNGKVNLTAITEPREIVMKHFIDSIIISKYIEKNKNVIDIGTGAGFPGIPLKIVRPDLKITLMDSLNKRIIFLEEICKELNLKNINAIHGRVEELGKDKKYREKYDYATTRAVAKLAVISEYMLPMVKIGGKCICMKGSNIEDEIQESKRGINILGGKIENIDNFLLCDTDIKRNNIILIKEKNTPSKYPRKPGIPTKEPLY